MFRADILRKVNANTVCKPVAIRFESAHPTSEVFR
jgi:hypothetical protein